jgi:hypothetical protein
MFGSYLVELVVGLSFLFAVLGLVTTAVTESVLAMRATRAAHLKEWLGLWTVNALGGSATIGNTTVDLTQLTSHPLLDQGRRAGSMPSYLPATRMAAALLQMLAMPFGQSCVGKSLVEAETALRSHIDSLNNPQLTKVLGPLLDSAAGKARDGGELVEALKTEVSAWIDESMGRIEGWTKRNAKAISLVVGAAICLSFNVSAYEVLNVLSSDRQVRTALANTAASFNAEQCERVAVPEAPAGAASSVSQAAVDARVDCLQRSAKEAVASLGSLSQLGIGWDNPPRFIKAWNKGNYPVVFGQALLWLLGVAAAAFAASLGGDFWFKGLTDIIRLTGFKPQLPVPEPAPAPTPASK